MITFKQYMKLQEAAGMGWNMPSPEAEQAMVWLMGRMHGAMPETLDQELNSPNLPYKLMSKFGVSPHDVQEVIQTAKEQYGVK